MYCFTSTSVYMCVWVRARVCVCVCECVSKQTNEGRRARCVGASHWKPEGPGANVSVLGTKSDRPTTFTNKYNKNQHTGSVKLQDSGWHWLVIGRHSPGARWWASISIAQFQWRRYDLVGGAMGGGGGGGGGPGVGTDRKSLKEMTENVTKVHQSFFLLCLCVRPFPNKQTNKTNKQKSYPKKLIH